jgi:REP element-mobilizing transposase RayT
MVSSYSYLHLSLQHYALVDSETYFLSVSRYIELNPVRTNIVAHPIDYQWSSFRVNSHPEKY